VSWLPYALMVPFAVVIWFVTSTLLNRRDKRRGLHKAAPAREEHIMSTVTYACEITVEAREGCAIPDDPEVGGYLYDILRETTAADATVPFLVSTMSIKAISQA
jgi:hypothetical protein